MTRLDVKLLGRMTCDLPGGQRLKLSTRKSEALLAYLAMSPGLHHSRERLVNLFWSDRGEDQARNSLRQALSSLKKALEAGLPELLEVERTSVRLKADKISVDVDAFRLLASESGIDGLVEAAEMYAGEFLEGVVIRDPAGEQWLTDERNNLKRIYVDVLGRLGQLQLDTANYKSAIASAERLVSIDALEESGWRLLMRANQGNGNRNHALMAYKRCCDVLQKELGVEPEAETQELLQRIKDGQSPTVIAQTPPTAPSIKPTVVSTNRDHSILVLPLKNLSNNDEQQYLSDGLTESIIVGLSLFPSIRVLSRNSSFAALQQGLSIEQIGQQFQVSYVVEGSVRKLQDQLRVGVQLIDSRSGDHLWGNQFDNLLEETFALEDKVTRSIVASIKGKIELADEEIAIRKPTRDAQSYDLLLQGYYHLQQYSPSSNHKAIEILLKCLELEPDNAVTHNRLYQTYIINWLGGWSAPRAKIIEEAGRHITRALALANDDALIQAGFAEYSLLIQDWEKAEKHADLSLHINPNDPEVLATVSAIYAGLGQVDKAIRLSDTCTEIDPFHPWIHWVAGPAYYRDRQYREALKTFGNMPNPADEIEGWMAACQYRLGNHEEASRHLRRYLETCQTNMAEFPGSLDEWRQHWTASASFKPIAGEDIDYPFDALCEAGLRDFVEKSENNETSETHSIAVLPFDNLSGDPEQEYFSDGISESIILNLSLFPGLSVKSRNSSFAFKQQIKDLGEISRELNVDYVVEGSIRKVRDRIRITVQLIEAQSGHQIWGKRYDSDIENLFDLEEELSRTIAATVTGQIESDLQRIALAKGAAGQQAYDLLLSGAYHTYRFNRQDTVVAIEKLNQCLAQDADNVRAHVLLYASHAMDYLGRWTLDYRASFKLAKIHILKALELGPEIGLVQTFYAEYLNFCGQLDEARFHYDKALAINPNDPDALAIKAYNQIVQGEFESALQTSESALQLDPYHPWVEWELAGAQYFAGNYGTALETIRKFRTSPGFTQIYVVAANVKLGRIDLAQQALQVFLQECRETMLSMPQTLDEWLAYTRETYPFTDPQINQDLVDCLKLAGLEEELQAKSGNAESEKNSAIVVLPFDNLSNDPDQEYFSDGITDSIILNLSSFPGLNVKSRNASFAFKQQIKNLGEISEELKVDYLVEGSIRKSDDQVRINVQLIEAASGNQVWGKRYDASGDNLFDLEAELSRTIAATVTGRIDSDLQRIALAKGAADQEAYDLLLEGIYNGVKGTRKANQIAIEKLNQCLALDPANTRAHVHLFYAHDMDVLDRWSEDPVLSRKLADHHILEAVSLDPEHSLVQVAYSDYLIFNQQFEQAQRQLNKALEKNPNDSEAITTLAVNLSCQGEFESALGQAELVLKLDPYHPWVRWIMAESQFFSGHYEDCLANVGNTDNAPGFIQVYKVSSAVKLGRRDLARQELKKFLQFCQENMLSIPDSIESWWEYSRDNAPFADSRFNQEIIDCLIKAGLENQLAKTAAIEACDEMPAILVLPFENMSGDPEQAYFSKGMTESIILALSSASNIKVKSAHTSFAYQDSRQSISEIGAELGVSYIVEGSIRKHRDQVRITVQLSESSSGNQIWGKRYDSPLNELFDLEEELVHSIAGAISGRIGMDIKIGAAQKPTRNMKSYDYLMRGWYYGEQLTLESSSKALEYFQKCIDIDPKNGEAYAFFAVMTDNLVFENWCEDSDVALSKSSRYYNRALELDPNSALVQAFMAFHCLLLNDPKQGMIHASRAIQLDPALPDGYSARANALIATGQIEEAARHADIALDRDPYNKYVGYDVGEVYRWAGNYDKSIEVFRSIPQAPPSMLGHIAANQVALGNPDEARKEMADYLDKAVSMMPQLPTSADEWRAYWKLTTIHPSDQSFDKFFDQLLQAGLCDNLDEATDNIPAIAVLPFENMSGDPEQEHFADGITTDIIATLSRFRHLRTMSRFSILKYKTEKSSIDEIATEQGVRYLLEGSVRRSGDRIRVSAELIDSQTHDAVWSERFDRKLDDLFAVQDEIAKSIALALKVHLDDGDMAIHRSTGTINIKAWELVLTAVDLQDTYIQKNILEARSMAEEATRLDPNYPYAWVSLGWTYWQQIYAGWGSDSMDELLAEAEQACQKAFDILPDYSEAWTLWGLIHLMKHEAQQALKACRRAVDLEPGNAEVQALMAFTYLFVDDLEKARKHNQNMLKLCPVLPNWYYLIEAETCRLEGNPSESIQIYRKGIDVEPESPLCRFYLIDALMETGDIINAQKIADEIRTLDDSVNGKGLVQAFSANKAIRESFRANLARFDLV